jgi:putative ABC transport system substrate-binding protein
MKLFSSKRVSASCSDKRPRGRQSKSGPADRNLKCIGIVAIAFTLALWGAVTEAQQQAKLPKIGWLGATPARPGGGPEVIRRDLRALGYVEGKNIAIEPRYADDKLDRLPALADELVRLRVDVLVASSTPAAIAAKNATRAIPIVFYNVADPVAAGLIDSLARPGGNITGVTNIVAVLAGKRLELLKETVPKLSRVAVLWNPQDPSSALQWKESQLPARELGLQLHSMQVSSADKYENAFKEAIKARSAAIAVTHHSLAASNQKQIADLAAKNRLPAIYGRGDYVDSGGLMSYGPDQAESYRRIAVFIDKILKGTNPSEIPVEQPMRFELVFNLKAAKQIGLTIPPNVLVRAQIVIR